VRWHGTAADQSVRRLCAIRPGIWDLCRRARESIAGITAWKPVDNSLKMARTQSIRVPVETTGLQRDIFSDSRPDEGRDPP
jgi:hypothetical protein